MTLCLRNRQRVCPIDLRLFRRIVRYLLRQHFQAEEGELCFHFVEAGEMANLNERFLDHIGPTDVITFDHGDLASNRRAGVPARSTSEATRMRCGRERPPADTAPLHGEIFICPAVAVAQAKEFRTSWQSELVRYAIHGLLHLQGHDDLQPAPRRKMKREEERILKDTARHFAIARLQRPPLK